MTPHALLYYKLILRIHREAHKLTHGG